MMDAFICDAIRTPIGRFGGALSSIRADDLAALSIKELKERNTSIDWSMVDEVIFGCANQFELFVYALHSSPSLDCASFY